MNWQKYIKSYFVFLFVILTFFSFLFYKLTDEKLTPRALDLLVTDGHIDQILRVELNNTHSIIRLPKDSIFDHQLQIQKIENQFFEFKQKIVDLKKDKSHTAEVAKMIQGQIENSLESLYAVNPMKFMALNLRIIDYCLSEQDSLSLVLDQNLKARLTSLDTDSLFLRAARFHAQSILGSIQVLRRSQFFFNPSIYLLQPQRLTNLMAEVSLNEKIKIAELGIENSWYKVHQMELVYVHFFKQLIYDSQVDLKSDVAQIHRRLKI